MSPIIYMICTIYVSINPVAQLRVTKRVVTTYTTSRSNLCYTLFYTCVHLFQRTTNLFDSPVVPACMSTPDVYDITICLLRSCAEHCSNAYTTHMPYRSSYWSIVQLCTLPPWRVQGFSLVQTISCRCICHPIIQMNLAFLLMGITICSRMIWISLACLICHV